MKDFNVENKEELLQIVQSSLCLLQNVSYQGVQDLLLEEFQYPCLYEDFVKNHDMLEEDEDTYKQDFNNSIFNINRTKSLKLVRNSPNYEGHEDIVFEVVLNSGFTFHFAMNVLYSSYNGYETDDYELYLVQPQQQTVINYVPI